MNKDLMMKAAIQFKGVWPDENETHLYTFSDGRFVAGIDGSAEVVCSRQQFKDFVSSLFDGAPDDATHSGTDGLFYKIGENSAYYWNFSDKWVQDNNGKDWLSKNLIPRPAKKAEPQAPWVPKVGEECEWLQGSDHEWIKAKILADIGDGDLVIFFSGEKVIVKNPDNFRPLRTERELFIEQATKDYLDQVGSDAVNAKWFERIFGALYDAGNLIYKN